MKKWIAAVLLMATLCGLLAGCKAKITGEQAYQVVLEDLGTMAEYAANPHIHTGTYENKPCFDIYVTVNGLSLQYIVSQTGKILHKGPGEHSH